MAKFIVDTDFFNLFPEANLGVIIFNGIDNSGDSPEALQALLEESNSEANKFLTEPTLSENPVINVYREAFKKFPTKKGARASIEALLKRTSKGNPVRSINPLVDLYNAASLRYGLPFGAEDIETFVGDLHLGVSDSPLPFAPIGEEENQPTLPGEVCYFDEAGAICRCLNWRDGQRTMITEKTTKAFLVSELLDPSRRQALEEALHFLENEGARWLGGQATIAILDLEHPSISL